MNPKVQYLMELKTRLSGLEIPIYFESQDETTLEPFLEIGTSTGNTLPSAKTNRVIRDDTQHIDIYLPSTIGRVEAENVESRALLLIGKARSVTSNLLRDDSIGRQVYHISIRVSNLIF